MDDPSPSPSPSPYPPGRQGPATEKKPTRGGCPRSGPGPGPGPEAARGKDVLILGDGNFSFSLAYARRFPMHRVTATSVDSQRELSAKYKEFGLIHQKLSKRGCRIGFEVDATDINGTLDSKHPPRGGGFDTIIFNFPHLGTEDLHAHQFLLCHFLNSAKESLNKASVDARVHVALTLDQARNWKLEHQAQRVGMHIERVERFSPSDWSGYECKRHQVNRSFPLQRANTYVLSLGPKKESMEASSSGSEVYNKPPQDILPSGGAQICTRCSRKFGETRALVNHMLDMHQTLPNFSKEELKEWSAIFSIPFKPDQYGSKEEHVKAMKQRTARKASLLKSIRSRFGIDWPDKRIIRSLETALRNQRQQSVRPTPRGNVSSPSLEQVAKRRRVIEEKSEKKEEAETSFDRWSKCELCDLKFSSVKEWKAHLRSLRPRCSEVLECRMCSETFREERALAQHVWHKHGVPISTKKPTSSGAVVEASR